MVTQEQIEKKIQFCKDRNNFCDDCPLFITEECYCLDCFCVGVNCKNCNYGDKFQLVNNKITWPEIPDGEGTIQEEK